MKVNEEGREREPKLLDFRVPEFNVVQESCCSISLSPNSISIPHKAREVKSWTVLRSSVNTGLGHDYNSLPRLSMSKSPRLIDNLGCKARGLIINSWFSSFHFLKLCRDCHSYISVKAITIGKKKKRNLIPLNLNQKTPSRDRDLIIYEKFSVLWQIMYCLRRKSISSRFLLNVYGKLFSVVFSFLVFVAACFFPSIGIVDKRNRWQGQGSPFRWPERTWTSSRSPVYCIGKRRGEERWSWAREIRTFHARNLLSWILEHSFLSRVKCPETKHGSPNDSEQKGDWKGESHLMED